MIKYTCVNHFMPEDVTGYMEEIIVCKYDDGTFEVSWSHCGNGKGCFWTEPVDITNDYHNKGIMEVLQSLKRDGFSIRVKCL